MLQIVSCLLIVPFLLGRYIEEKTRFMRFTYPVLFFVLGFLVMVAEFAIICYSAIYFHAPFHLVYYVTNGVYILESLAIFLWLLFTKRLKLQFTINNTLVTLLKSPSFWIMIILCGSQILRLIIGEPSEMRDSKSYSALIVDILQSDQLFMINPENGFPLGSVLEMPVKFFLSTWYPFISMLSKLSGLHPLVITNSVLPGYLLLLHYFILYTLGQLLFEGKRSSAFQFTAICAFIYELTLYRHTPTLIKLVWPVWGKGALSMTVIPAVFVLFILYAKEYPQTKGLHYTIVLFLLVLSGCSMSTMAAVVLPLELGLLGVIWAVKHRSFRPLLCSMVSMIPSALYAFTYYYLSRL